MGENGSGQALTKYKRALNVPVQSLDNMKLMLNESTARMVALLPKFSGVPAEKIISTAIMAAHDTPKILQCTGASILASVALACEFGLTFSKPLGQAYLVPFKGRCTLIIGYRGLMDLVHRAADVTRMDAKAVYEDEHFAATSGSAPSHTIRVDVPRDKQHLVAVYAVAYYPDGGCVFSVMSKEEVDKIRARSKAADSGPWVTDYVAMAVKTVIRQLVKLLPVSAEKARLFERAIQHEDAATGITDALPDSRTPKEKMGELEERLNREEEPDEPGIQEAELVDENKD